MKTKVKLKWLVERKHKPASGYRPLYKEDNYLDPDGVACSISLTWDKDDIIVDAEPSIDIDLPSEFVLYEGAKPVLKCIKIVSDRFLCTKDTPYTAGKGHSLHLHAMSDGGCFEGCCDDYKCPVCGITWREELPQ